MYTSVLDPIKRWKDDIKENRQYVESHLKNTILKRAKENTIYLPLATIVYDKGETPTQNVYVSKVFLKDGCVYVELYPGNIGSVNEIKTLEFSHLTEYLRDEITDSLTDKLINEQKALRAYYREFRLSYDYYIYESRFRHALVDSITQIYLANENVLGNSFEVTMVDRDTNKTIKIMWRSHELVSIEESRMKSGYTYMRRLNDFSVNCLKLIKDKMKAEIYRRKNS